MLSTHVEIMESLGRLGVALALGSVIGFERQWRQKIAGLRTNALVALGSCGFVVFSAMVCRSAHLCFVSSSRYHLLESRRRGFP